MALRQKGDGKGRLGGRKAGTPNKVTKPMRELLANFCEQNFEEFVAAFHVIADPKDKCKVYLDAQAFVTPKLSSVDLKADTGRKSYEEELEELEKERARAAAIAEGKAGA